MDADELKQPRLSQFAVPDEHQNLLTAAVKKNIPLPNSLNW